MTNQVIESVSATILARNISQTIDHVRINRTSINITKGHKVIAKLSPPAKEGLAIDGLIELLKKSPKLDKDDALLLSDDLDKIRNTAVLSENPWD